MLLQDKNYMDGNSQLQVGKRLLGGENKWKNSGRKTAAGRQATQHTKREGCEGKATPRVTCFAAKATEAHGPVMAMVKL